MTNKFDFTAITALVVDANTYHRSVANDVLRLTGVKRVFEASTAEAGVDLIRDAKPDLVLLEWMKGPLGGVNFLHRVRKDPTLLKRAVPILMLTEVRTITAVQAARAAGADGYLIKPLSSAMLADKIVAVVGKPQPFIAAEAYVGPCRRRRDDADYDGPSRRESDAAGDAASDAPDGQPTRRAS